MSKDLNIIVADSVEVTVNRDGEAKKIRLQEPSALRQYEIAKKIGLKVSSDGKISDVDAAQGIMLSIESVCASAKEEVDGKWKPVDRKWVEGLPISIITQLSNKIPSSSQKSDAGEAVTPAS